MDYPTDLRYANDHEWLRSQEGRCRVGITQFAANQLGDIVVVELPLPGQQITRGDRFGTIESVKSVSELYAPVSGKVVAINTELKDSPELVNTDPHGDGWMIEVEPSDPAEIDALMTAEAYGKFVAESE